MKETPHRKITEDTDYSMLYDEEFILLSDSRQIKDSLFCTLSVMVAIWDNYVGLNYKLTKYTYNAKENNKRDAGIKTKDILYRKI